MEANIKWLDDPEVFQVNRKKAHSDHMIYASKEDMEQGRRSYCQLLSGEWRFHYSVNAKERPADFYKKGYDYSGFDTIKVPGHIELAGYDKIHYINTMYPWDGHFYRRPAYTMSSDNTGEGMFSEADYNPVGSYITTFKLDEALKGKKVSVYFEGVEQAMYVWLNGHFVGYAEDTFTPSEFDLTEYLEEENVLAVEVHKRSSAAFLEDQDFFRFFGIFRDVVLIGRCENHLEDMWIQPRLLENNTTGTLDVQFTFEDVQPGAKLDLAVTDPAGCEMYAGTLNISEQFKIDTKTFEQVQIWDTKTPNLYKLELYIIDVSGAKTQYVCYPFGFRRIEIKDKVILLNGKRLIINGVNRHEWSPYTGRAITKADMEQDMAIIKNSYINAVRTCHYPCQIPWYYMCDAQGIYVMAETNLESHGTWQKLGACEPSYNVPGALPQWLEVVLDRARSNFMVLKNHTSILFWSLGNESYADENIRRMDAYFKEMDPERLTHYESNFWNPDFEDSISDVKSRMYPQPKEIAEYLENDPKKPFILCEYMHSMGNSLGGMNSYMDLLDKYEMYQGGFIWDFVDQALFVKDEITGQDVLRYGGDFDDKPSDYEFSGNGILFADRTEKPAMQEVKYYYAKYSE